MFRFMPATVALLIVVIPVSAQTADEIIAKYVKTIGGAERIQAIKTLRRAGKIIVGPGFEMTVLEENKRPNLVRRNMSMQGITAVNAYDGQTGWKIEPWTARSA